MSLRRKTLLIAAVLVIGLVITTYVILAGILTPNFARIEQQSMIRDVQRVMNAVSTDLANLSAQARDYAAWDDTYAFAEDGNADFAANNLIEEVYSNYQLNLILVVNTTGGIVYGNGYDLIGKQFEPVPGDLLKRLTGNDRLLQHPTLEGVTGILILPEGAMLLASQPILPTTGTAPSRGSMIMGRYLSTSEIERLAQMTQLPFSLSRLDDPQLSGALKTAVAQLSNEKPIISQPLSDETISGLGLLTDYDGNPALLLRLDQPRTIYQEGQISLRYVGAALLAVGLLFALLSLLFLDKSVLTRIAQLSATINQIDTQHNLSAHVPVTGDDELASLARSFNNMTAQLKNSLDLLEERVQARTTQLQVNAEISRAATPILDPTQLLKQVVTMLTERFNFYYASIFLIDETGRWAVLSEASGPGDVAWVLKEVKHRLEVGGQSMVSTAITSRQPTIALDVNMASVRFANPLLPDTHSEIALPLIIGDRVLGALNVQSAKVGAFDESNAMILQSMADQIAIALNNAAQYHREADRAQQFTNLLQATLELSSQPDRPQLLQRATQVALALVDADGAGLWFPIDEATLELQYSLNVGPVEFTSRRLRIGDGLSGQVFAGGLILRVDDYLSWSGHSTTFADAPFHSAMGVPLMWQNQVLGVLVVTRSNSGHPFTIDDENMAQLLAAQAAAALDNLRLRAEQARAVEDLNTLNRKLTGEAWQAVNQKLTYEHLQTSNLPSTPALSLHIPIELRGTPIGTITLEDEQARTFTEDEQALIAGVTQQLALALENQRLTDVAQLAAQRDRAIAETADKIHQPTSLEAILQVAVTELSRVTGISGVGVQLGFAPAQTNGHNGHPADRAQENE